MKLNLTERWVLSNQYQILGALYPDQAEFYSQAREAVENGYELNYKWITEYIDENGLSSEGCLEVLDILRMFSSLQRAYGRIADKSDVPEAIFPGFDAN